MSSQLTNTGAFSGNPAAKAQRLSSGSSGPAPSNHKDELPARPKTPAASSNLQLADNGGTTGSPLFEPQSGAEETPLFQTDEPTAAPHGQAPAPLETQPAESSAPVTSWLETAGQYLSGKAILESRTFPDPGLQSSMDYHHNFSAAIEPQFRTTWSHGTGELAIVPFARWDEHDNKRTHYDVREFLVSQKFANLAVRVGIGRVFWGVTESRHTVDIINQTDLVENPDGEQKLGQPMLNLSYTTDFGTAQLFFLPFSRARTFPGKFGRIRPPVPVEEKSPKYEGGASTHHPDFAARWSTSLGALDLGVSHFHGTTREPVWRLRYDANGTATDFIPVYELIDQTAIDVAWVQGSWLWKLEAFTRSGQGRAFQQVTGGFEYTVSGIFDSGADLGLLMEYLFDGRERKNLTSAFQHDLFLGTRLGLNDPQDSQLLGGISVDTTFGTVFYNLEASRRIGETWKINFEARGFASPPSTDIYAYAFRREKYFMMSLEKYF